MADNNDEQFERIPWEQLRTPPGSRRNLVYVVAAAVAAAGISAALSRNFAPDTPSPDTTASPAVVTTPVLTTTTTLEPAPWTEADLMAIHPEELKAEAGVMAEWFVSDYFSVDGTEQLRAEVGSLLPAGVDVSPPLTGHRSFVEWARTTSVVEEGPAEFAVVVVVRSLGAGPGEGYERVPLRAVEVILRWTDDGWSVIDLPSPTSLPRFSPAAGEYPQGEIPPEVSAQALDRLGPGARVIGGGVVDGRWRIVVEDVDQAGGVWPLVLWLDSPGS
jgi:hypothetical protein